MRVLAFTCDEKVTSDTQHVLAFYHDGTSFKVEYVKCKHGSNGTVEWVRTDSQMKYNANYFLATQVAQSGLYATRTLTSQMVKKKALHLGPYHEEDDDDEEPATKKPQIDFFHPDDIYPIWIKEMYYFTSNCTRSAGYFNMSNSCSYVIVHGISSARLNNVGYTSLYKCAAFICCKRAYTVSFLYSINTQ